MKWTGKFLIYLGFILLVLITIIFLWRESIFNFSNQINFEKLNQYGNVVGGVLGSIWTLAGVLLYYGALIEQQKLLKKQSILLENQNFENSLFNLSVQWDRITSSLTYNNNTTNTVGRLCFKKYYNDFKKEYNKIKKTDLPEEEKISEAYNNFYLKTNGYLSHYFITFYELLKHINTRCNGENDDKISYAGIVRSQITNDELILLVYNAISFDYGRKKTIELMRNYNITKRMDIAELISPEHFDLYKSLPNRNE